MISHKLHKNYAHPRARTTSHGNFPADQADLSGSGCGQRASGDNADRRMVLATLGIGKCVRPIFTQAT